MKEVAILLVVALMLSITSCNNYTTVQQGTGAIWSAQLLGGEGPASGFSFITQFTFNQSGAFTFYSFQFLNGGNGSCFPYTGVNVNGSLMDFQFFQNTLQVTGNLSLAVKSGNNILTITGPLTGTASETGQMGDNTITLTSASVIGTWTFTGSGTGGCNDATGSFTMTESTT